MLYVSVRELKVRGIVAPTRAGPPLQLATGEMFVVDKLFALILFFREGKSAWWGKR